MQRDGSRENRVDSELHNIADYGRAARTKLPQEVVGYYDGGALDEFQADYAKEMICGTARIDGILVGVIANSRGMTKGKPGKPPKFGGKGIGEHFDRFHALSRQIQIEVAVDRSLRLAALSCSAACEG